MSLIIVVVWRKYADFCIVSEFNESGMGDFEVEEEVPINEDRARAVRFA